MTVTMACHTFAGSDGMPLAYRAYVPDGAARGVLFFHRGHEHGGRWRETMEKLDLPGTAFFAWDQRGHGASPGLRGHAANLAMLTQDAEAFSRHIAVAHGIAAEDTAVVASSVGAVVAAAWVHDFAPRIRGMVLAAPAFCERLYVPGAIPALRVLHHFSPRSEVKSYVKSKMLTHDRQEAAAYDADPLIFRQIAVNVLLDLHDAGRRMVADAGAIVAPTLVLSAGRDWVVRVSDQRKFFERLGSRVKQWEVYPEFYHALFQETGRERVMARTGEFLRQCFAERPERAHLLNADMGGPMRTECDLLRAPENGMGKMSWPAVRSGIRLASAFSEGLRLGREAGFDSGIMLDYVYRNKADGITPLGRVIDSFYLNSIGWRGIRVRRQNSQRLLRRAIESFPADVPLHILDVAAGAGRYLLQTMQHFPGRTITAHLRDYQEANLAAAGKLAAERRLTGVTRQCADAFDAESILALKVPQIAIASGIFELMEMNAPVARCLGALSRLMGKGSVLIYTNQPWHPQLEFIARGLTNHRGKPWLMRRRSQAEMDELVRAAGFEKAEQAIDPYGIFTVALARKG